ncbi:hypothetical protein V495_03030 [Pseudogymnoascus sp. VKM F-4514 (FW-929)]|nr:hypothetical protein V495_03030 [Pseudogymnoascus sp. VKM F-4514 (FW-929)]KFY54475.1 hypothetical protein V497_07677 [Pseudogymnoascus sp. VKM F-4516 (FW-969)]
MSDCSNEQRAHCAKCGTSVGDFENLWNRIGKRHFSPVSLKRKDWSTGLQHSGDVRIAPTETMIEDSYLQDLACVGCEEILGCLCHNAPPGHILQKDQIILHLNKMKVVSRSTGEPCTPIIKHAYPLKRNGPKGGQDDNAQENEINGHDHNLAVADSDHPDQVDVAHRLQQLTKFADWAEVAIDSQKRDIDRISVSVNKIETDMRSFKDFMTMVRKELAIRPTNAEMEDVRASVHSLRDEIDQSGSMNDARPARESLAFEDIDLITESITSMSQKVNEIDSLKLEIQFLKIKLKRSEEVTRKAGKYVGSRQSTPPPTSTHRHDGSSVYVEPPLDQLQRNSRGSEKHTSSSPVVAENRTKRARLSGKDVGAAVAPNVQPGSTLRKPSRLSHVLLPVSQDHLAADVDELDMAPVYDITDDTFEPKPQTATRRSARSGSPLNEEQSVASKPSWRNAHLRTSQNQKTKPSRKSRGGSEELDPDFIPLTAKGTKDRRYKRVSYSGRRRDSMDPGLKRAASGNLQGRADDMENAAEDDIVESVERDDAPTIPLAMMLDPAGQQQITDEERQRRKQETLLARERLVKDTIDREMNMAI